MTEENGGCNNPQCACSDPTFDPLESIKGIIERQGFGTVGVFPTDPDDPKQFWFTYTVGLTELGLPELAVAGMPSRPAQALLSALIGAMKTDVSSWRDFFVKGGGRRTLPPESGLATDLEFVRVQERDDNTPFTLAVRLYGDVMAFQVIFPDDKEHFPADLEYDAATYPQPMLTRY